VKFVQSFSLSPAEGDGANSVFFSNTVYGEAFGTNTLAVTLNVSQAGSGVFTETDVIFNLGQNWDSYRGPIQGVTYDFHRVALHEFGHVLGLAHPDEHGQNVSALMNSIISDLDHLSDDDIAGARALYAGLAFRADLGADFRYQVQANNNATSFTATGLPPGLTIDGASGLISGIATISGTYSVVVVANAPGGSIMITLQITVAAPKASTIPGTVLQKLAISVNRLASDPTRPRVYATVPDSNSVAVIDTVNLSILKNIPIGSNPTGLAVSADGSRLWVANNSSATSSIGVVDLNTLETLPSLPVPNAPYDVEEGLGNRLYVTSENHGIMQIDARTGASLGNFYGASFLEISPDRKTLFVAGRGGSPSYMTKFDVSTPTPTLLQNVFGNGLDLKLSPSGEFICFFVAGPKPGFGPDNTLRTPTSNLSINTGYFDAGGITGPTAWSGDSTVLYESLGSSKSAIAIFDANSLAKTGQISLGSAPHDSSGYSGRDMVVDNSGSRLVIATAFYPSSGDVQIIDTGRRNNPKVLPPAPRSLANVSTRLRVQPGDGALIGGFIIQGSEAKTVVARAVGPSLPLSGKLADPTLELHDSTGAVVVSNDNWNSDRARVLNSGLAPNDEHEATTVVSLSPGAYTAVVRGASDTTGIGLVEVYDVDPSHSRLANISTRGVVESGDNVLIGGFIIGGDQPTKIIVRGIGPSLAASGIANPLQDPMLELHDGNGALITENDDWRSLQEDAIKASGIPPSNEKESAIVATLSPGNYTAIVRGKGEQPGVGLVEIYNLDAN
jgi:YVTN family beta-propeller protein